MGQEVFIDTSGWACLLVSRSTMHRQALITYDQIRKQKRHLVTTNYVINELVALLASPLRVPRLTLIEYIEAIKSTPLLTIIYIDASLDGMALHLLKDRPDKDWSLTDAASFVIMKQMHIQDALTTDHHFEQAGYIRLLK